MGATLLSASDMTTSIATTAPILLILFIFAQNFHIAKSTPIQNKIDSASSELEIPRWKLWELWFQFHSSMDNIFDDPDPEEPAQESLKEMEAQEATRDRREDMRMIRLRKSLPMMRLRRTPDGSYMGLPSKKMKVVRL